MRRLHYTEAVIKESMRYITLTPLALFHCAMQDTGKPKLHKHTFHSILMKYFRFSRVLHSKRNNPIRQFVPSSP